MNGWRLAFAAGAMLLSVAPAASSDHPSAENVIDAQLAGHNANRPLQFRVESSLAGHLYPGKMRQIRLTIATPNGYPIRVSQIRARVIATSQRGCPPNSASLIVGS